MKRSQSINLDRMRHGVKQLCRPNKLYLAVSVALGLVACSPSPNNATMVFDSIEQCVKNNFSSSVCSTHYENALMQHQKNKPKYESQRYCEEEFRRCESNDNGTWSPYFDGFVLEQSNCNTNESGQCYRSSSSYFFIGAFGSRGWYDGNGSYHGRESGANSKRKGRVENHKATTRTMSRGGFGSTAVAKSSWGSQKSRSKSRSFGWGG